MQKIEYAHTTSLLIDQQVSPEPVPLPQRHNAPPEHGIRVPAAAMRAFMEKLFARAGLAPEDGELLGGILTGCDLRCVFTHGTQAAASYLRHLRDGEINPRPRIKVVHEAPGALVLDGDGGLGYFPCWRGTEQIIAKAKSCGSAVLTTRNHHHFGAAGIYTRQAIGHGCIGLAASNHRTERPAEQPVHRAIANSPLSIGVPARQQPPLVLDMGSSILDVDQAISSGHFRSLFKALGLSNAVQILGGAAAGIYLESCRRGPWIANQGSFIAVFDGNQLMPPGQLQDQVDRYLREARAMQPVPGREGAELAGGLEWNWERQNRRTGIPVGDHHLHALEEVAGEWDVESPFGEWEKTRF